MMKLRFGWLAVGVIFAIGCGATRKQGYLVEAGPGQETVDAEKVAKAEELWSQRGDVAKLREALQAYEELAKLQPSNRDVLARLARGYYLLANGYLTQEEEILAAYHTGASWGERILGLCPQFKERIAAGDDDNELLSLTSKDDVPGIYWAYANLGKWSSIKGFTTKVKNKSKLKAFIDRVAELSPDYYHGAGDRGLGAFYAIAPSLFGGDLDKSKEHFEKSLTIAPDYLGTKVLMAEHYAVKMQDRQLFEKLLNEVIGADTAVLSDIVPMQNIEQRKAKKLLVQAEDLFE